MTPTTLQKSFACSRRSPVTSSVPSVPFQRLSRAPQSCDCACSLKNTGGFWDLTIDGRSTVLRQNHALFYLAALIANPNGEPMSIPALAREVFQKFGAHPDFLHGGANWLLLHADEPDLSGVLRMRQSELETILDSAGELEILKAEATRELEMVYALQETLPLSERQCSPDSQAFVVNELRALHSSLALAVTPRGEPDTAARLFAIHILVHILIPSLAASAELGDLHFACVV